MLQVGGAGAIEVQSNDPLAAAMLHSFARDVVSEKILFRDGPATALAPPGAIFRHATRAEAPDAGPEERQWRGVVEVDGQVAATGGVLFHYNPPYGDIYMEVAEPFRRRGLGSYLVQELKRLCHESGRLPAARCDPANIPSRRTLQKAGFVPCGHILCGSFSDKSTHFFGTSIRDIPKIWLADLPRPDAARLAGSPKTSAPIRSTTRLPASTQQRP